MSIISYLKGHAVLATTIVVVAVVAGIIAGRVSNRSKTTVSTDTNIKQVALVSVDSFRSDSSVVAADGVVESVAQVDIKSQLSGPLANVTVALGDQVYEGQVIAEILNTDIRAQLAQAETALSVESVSVDSAKRSAIDTIRDAYQKSDDAVHTQLDQFVLNTVGTGPKLSSYVTDTKLYNDILTTRIDLVAALREWKTNVDALSESSSDATVQAVLAQSEKNVDTVRALLDNVSRALNTASTIAISSDLATLNSWKTIVASARASMSQTVTALTGADKGFRSALATHGSGEGAPVSVAASNVQNLQAQLAKTIFRAPISGKIAALPLRTGELATPGQLIATVVGPGGLEVNAYMSGDDISRIEKGSKATIQNSVTGTVVNIAPTVNPINKKAQVRVRVDNSDASGLVVGQNVSMLIQAKNGVTNTGTTTQKAIYRLPIQNVKIVPGDAYVFTVNTEGKAVQNRVTLGAVQGDFVEITSGITPGMKIISPVYEIDEGQTVNVNNNG